MFPNVQFDLVEKIDSRYLEQLVETLPVDFPTIGTGLDRFAALRQAGFARLTGQNLLNEGEKQANAYHWGDLDILSYMTAIEYDWAQAFAAGFSLEQAPFGMVDPYIHSAMLRGLNRSRIPVDKDLLRAQIGVSDSSNALIRDALLKPKQQIPLSDQKPHQGQGITIAQFMFLGEIGQAGKGDSGGLGVFLASLGNALGRSSDIKHVYTFVLGAGENNLDYGPSEGAHTIIPVRLPFENRPSQREMMAYEDLLEDAVWQLLIDQNIQPDIFHLRYADHGSLAVMRAAKRLGKKIVFTLTADPHRALVEKYNHLYLSDAGMDDLDFDLQRVYVADRLLEESDGIVAMPNSAGLEPLKAYFPQFQFDLAVQDKPLAVLAEGIELTDPDIHVSSDAETLFESLSQAHSKAHGQPLPLDFFQRPLLLNVGRLHPIKQQHLLVKAWASSSLWQTYNLMLIGGNLENPGPVEAEMLASISATLNQYPGARRHFCLLPAMDNQKIREIEAGLIKSSQNDVPHTYVCSSVKEEFGIAVLEAMDAGFLVIGPERGGLSSYVDHGTNGFLMDTSSDRSIANALQSILSEQRSEELGKAASAGQATVRARFDIQSTAQAFVNFYREVLA
jgi:glycosyltransferase involved in cell wall biosynthesis